MKYEMHKEIGSRLKTMQDELTSIDVSLSNSYKDDPALKVYSEAIKSIQNAADQLTQIRSSLEDKVCTEFPEKSNEEVLNVYYGEREYRPLKKDVKQNSRSVEIDVNEPLNMDGFYFHSFEKEDDGSSRICYQGRILKNVRKNYFLCEIYSWLSGEPSYRVFGKDEVNSFAIYETRKDMLLVYAEYAKDEFDDEIDYEREIERINNEAKEWPLDLVEINNVSYAELMPPLYGYREVISESDYEEYQRKYGLKKEGFFNRISLSDFANVPPPTRMLKAIHDHTGIYLMGGHDTGCRNYHYHIAWNRISSFYDVLHWFKHLLEKEWFDTEMVEDILVCIERHRSIDFHLRAKLDRQDERKKINRSVRYTVLNRDGFRCKACGKSSSDDGVSLEVDHIIPLSKGGSSDMINLQTLCKECNRGKHTK